MLEMKISITAKDLAAAINNLAKALEGAVDPVVLSSTPQPLSAVADLTAQPETPIPTVNPTPAQVPGAPLSVTPAPIAVPVPQAPIAPVAPMIPAPSAPMACATTPIINPTPAVPTSAPTYTLEMIATAGSSLIDAGKLDALMALLGKYGVDSLTNLAPEYYGSIAMELRAMGARL